MTTNQEIGLKSQEVQELLGIPPHWMLVWGTSFSVIAIIVLGMIGWLFKYPEIVTAPVTISKELPPQTVVAEKDGIIVNFLVKENQKVKKGDILAITTTDVDYGQIERLEAQLNGFQPFNSSTFSRVDLETDLSLGSIQPAYNDWIGALRDHELQASSDLESINIREIQNRIDSYEKLIAKAVERSKDAHDKHQLLLKNRNQLQRDYSERRISLEDYRQRLAEIKAAELTVQTIESEIESNKNQVIRLKGEINKTKASSKNDKTYKLERINETFKRLKSTLDSWKKENLISAKEDGTISFFNEEVTRGKYFQQGEPILALLPLEGETLHGKVDLPLQSSVKVKEGQKVLIRLSGYPYQQFGKVPGVVSFKAKVPRNDVVAVEVTLPDGLVTTKGKGLVIETQLVGYAEITTNEERFFFRIFDSLFRN